ncbi:PX domain-containing protein kinase-like protein-like [Homarus americanus]|uniref:PX domain-containing protein kinase-like protein-like n=1 Tax=Homarus americanus TaxID=6706 RepID=A0A8J5JVY1_HOMAM|nr:PX domain-containing protein kinase-like protein-like [Homarus americanus]
MSVFEKKKEDRLSTDDTKPLVCNITDAQNTDGHIEYTLEVWRTPDTETKWTVSHRYSDFAQLHAALKVGAVVLPQLPPKKVFGNTDRDFINERRVALQKYLEGLLSNLTLAASLPVKRFLDPKNYTRNFQEEARQNVHIILRSGGSHEVTEVLPSCGTRICKEHFLAHPLADPKSQHVLWWAPFGPDRAMNLRDTHATLTALVQCQHPYIVPAISNIATEAGVCVVRPWFPQGSVRDMIHQAKPRGSSLVKYSSDKLCSIQQKDCAIYGRQILEALLFLHEKGLGHGHLHTGNLVIDNNVCRLLELENQVVGLPNQLRSHMIHHRKINSIEAIDVYCFGHVLYEMIFQKRLTTNTCNELPPECPALSRSVLESILSAEACKNGLPTVPLHSYEKPSLRLPSSVKQAIALSHEAMFTRLAADQKKIRQQRKLSKFEAFVSQQSSKNRSKKHLHLETNGESAKSNERSPGDSVNNTGNFPNSNNDGQKSPSSSSQTSSLSPPPPPPPPTLVTPLPPPVKSIPDDSPPGKPLDLGEEHAALLSSISGFKKGKLRRTETNDRSAPSI